MFIFVRKLFQPLTCKIALLEKKFFLDKIEFERFVESDVLRLGALLSFIQCTCHTTRHDKCHCAMAAASVELSSKQTKYKTPVSEHLYTVANVAARQQKERSPTFKFNRQHTVGPGLPFQSNQTRAADPGSKRPTFCSCSTPDPQIPSMASGTIRGRKHSPTAGWRRRGSAVGTLPVRPTRAQLPPPDHTGRCPPPD